MTEDVLDGRYRLVRLLGRGGMGEVWRAHDARIGREVAVKIVTANGMTAEALARFDREARIVGNLSGPSIVTVHDYGHDEYGGKTVPYLVMELVAGRTIAERVRAEGPAAPATALGWARQICEALTVAHTADVVHRDIKPSNVMVTDSGAVKVLDFGIARFVEREQTDTGLTASGTVVGSAEYMSPEQAQGERVDARSDLYSLGCLLYFTLTGRSPFGAGSPVGVAYQHVNKVPEPPSRYRPNLPPAMDALVMGLLAKDPDERPADARAVAARIGTLLAAAEAEAAPDPLGETKQLVDTKTLPPTPAPTGPTEALPPPTTPTTPTVPTPAPMPTAPPPNGTPPGTSRNGDFWVPAPENLSSPTHHREPSDSGNQPGALLPSANHSRRWFLAGAATLVGVGGVGAYLALENNSKTPGGAPGSTPSTNHAAANTTPALPTPVAAAKLTGHQGPVNHIAFSPDSKILASASQDNTARLYDVSDPTHPKTLGVCTLHTAMVFDVAISPDGHTLATSSYDQTLGLWDIRDPDAPRLLHQLTLGNRLTGVRFSPDGGLLAVGAWGGSVKLIDTGQPADTTRQWSVSGHDNLVYGIAFSPDGKTLVSGSFDKSVKLWDVRNPAAAKLLGTATGHTDRVYDVAYHPGGTYVAAGSADRSLIFFDVTNPSAPTVRTRLPEPDEATGVAFSPDGRLVANGSGASAVVRLYDVTKPSTPRTLPALNGPTDYSYGVAFSPNGKVLAVADQDRSVRLWRL